MDARVANALTLVSKLASSSVEQQRQGVRELRLLAKRDADNRIAIAKVGAIPLLLRLLATSIDDKIQEDVVTALLNLSICISNKHLIVDSQTSLDVILQTLTGGITAEARENVAALLFSLMVVEDHRPVIGQRQGMISGLLNLARKGSERGCKDALRALFHVALWPENRPFVVKQDAISVLSELLMEASLPGVVEDALAVLAQAVGCPEAIDPVRSESIIPLLVSLIDTGSSRAQENATSALLNLCRSGGEDVIEEVNNVGPCISSLSTLLNTGSVRAKNKASSLLKLLVVG